MDIERLQKVALDALVNWDITKPSLSLLKHRENTVFKVVAEDTNYVLRIHRGGYHSEQAIACELAWLSALHDSGLQVPELVLTAENHLFTKVDIDGSTRIIDVFTWVDGITLTDCIDEFSIEEIKSLYFKVGKTTAQLHQQSSTWQKPSDFQRHHWDVDGLVGNEPFWGKFWELEILTPEQRKVVLEARVYLQERLASYPKNENSYGLIHADMIPDNLMLSGDELYIIDFDDGGFGFYFFELATILHPLQEKVFFESARDALLKGYAGFRELDGEEMDYLDDFRLARALTYLGWYHDRPDLQKNTTRVNRAIERVLSLSSKVLTSNRKRDGS